jgi:outer membrane protein, heavy metal efflux system
MYRSIIITAALALAVPAGAGAQERVLSLDETYRLAREGNPMLRAAAARVAAAAAATPSASLPPDPAVQLGVMNASLPRLDTDMPGAMLPSVQVMQMIPTAGKLRLSGQLARQGTAMLYAEAEEMWWEVRARAAMAYHEIYEADRQLEVMQETLDWLRQFEQVATTMYSVGSGRQSDVLRAGVEVARMKAEIARMRAMRSAAAARLNAVLGRDAATEVPGTEVGPTPIRLPAAAELQQWAEEDRPLLARSRIGVERARTRETLARRELWPDLSVGVQYGQRPSDMGTKRMGSLMVGFSVPVFASRRQLPMREEAAAMREMAVAELDDARAQVGARIGELLAELERAATLMSLYRTEVLPQAEANVTSAFSSYRVGRVDFMTLVDAQMTLNTYTQELYALTAEYGWKIAELEMVVGREVPADLSVEEGA